MKRVLLLSALGLTAIGVLLVGVSALSPLGRAPLSLQAWLLSPVACVSVSCVTYAKWSAAVQRDRGAHDSLDILTALLEERAITIVAFRERLRVSDDEVSETLASVRSTLGEVPGGRDALVEAYGANPERLIRDGLRKMLLREKLAASGIPSPWKAPHPPPVTVWNIHLRWDPAQQKVVARTPAGPADDGAGALAGEQKKR